MLHLPGIRGCPQITFKGTVVAKRCTEKGELLAGLDYNCGSGERRAPMRETAVEQYGEHENEAPATIVADPQGSSRMDNASIESVGEGTLRKRSTQYL